MATDQRNVAWSNLNDASFRSWGKGISDALAAVGLTKLSGAEAAGQIDWATVLAPTVADNKVGYELWRFSDALQATAPVFIKVQYGSGQRVTGAPPTPKNRPKITIMVGTGVTAATGALTGVQSEEFYIAAADWDGAVPPTLNNVIYTSGANNRIAQICAHDNVHPAFVLAWAISRTKDGNGNDTPDGVIIQTHSASIYNQGSDYSESGFAMQQVLLFTGVQADSPVRSIYDGGPAFMAGHASSKTGVVGPDTAVFPWIVPSSRGLENPSLNFLSAWSPDIGNGSIFAVRMYGANHNYRMFGQAGIYPTMYQDNYTTTELQVKTASATGLPNTASSGLAMRWE